MPIMVADTRAAALVSQGLSALFHFMLANIRKAESKWVFSTSESAALGVGLPGIKFGVGVNGGELFLSRGGTGEDPWQNAPERVRIGYGTLGIGIGLSIPLGGGFSVSASYSSTDWPNCGVMFPMPGAPDFRSPQDFNEHNLPAPCCIIAVDGALVPLRWLLRASPGTVGLADALPASRALDKQFAGAAAAMFLGVNPVLFDTLKQLFRNLKALCEVAFRAPPKGFWASVEDGATRPFEMGWDLAKAEYDLLMIIARLQSFATMSRAVLFSAGVEAALPGVGIGAYFGALKAWENKGPGIQKNMVESGLDHIPKPFTTD